MKYPSLANLIEKLKFSPRVKDVFTIGATAIKMNPSSDIDFAVILDKNDEIYHQALKFRLLYSVIELITAYFSFRGIPWRGEKTAVKYLKQNDPVFLSIFLECSRSSNLNKKMKHYQRIFERIFFGELHADFE